MSLLLLTIKALEYSNINTRTPTLEHRYSMRLTDINNDGTMDVTFWTTGSELRIFEMSAWSDGSYNENTYSGPSTGQDPQYSLGNTLRPVFTKNEGADTAQAKYTLSTTPQYCNMYDSNTGGT